MKRLNSSELYALSQLISDAIKPLIIQTVREAISQRRDIMMPKDVANMLHVSTAAVQKRCQRNLLPFHKDATGHYFFYSDEIKQHFSIIDNTVRSRL